MNLIEQAKDYVEKLFKDKLSNSFTYHNIQHTIQVVEAISLLAKMENVSVKDSETLQIAAWFHDTGYTNCYDHHEAVSVSLMRDFLSDKVKSSEFIDQVASLIMSTKFGYEPQTLLEKIMKDGDCFHLSAPNYATTCNDLREEWACLDQKKFSDKDWILENIDFLTNTHRYYTDYALEQWQPLKEKNIKKLQKKIKKMGLTKGKDLEFVPTKKEKEDKPDRAVDTLFRVTLNNHTTLSGIADSKANILLSVNAIIISIALSILIPKLDSPKNVHLMIPTFIMLMSSVTTIIFAILSTRPKVTKGIFTRQDIENQKVNLLFFGNFYKMPLEEYQWAMNEMMKDKEYLYNSMIKDLYYLGVVLEKKYRLLRLTYNFFMIGIIISVIAFVIAFRMG
ncbi:DUF5706 domain-containing protein [Flavobacterium sp. CHNK8]|uniref:Pycsar system effector family protein n=1 Tax=Flavobacterium sp. CHNK8 TaxID=2871165 RepID=UPI001C8D4B6C|nr:Pycsar system effector family protein [Flavobacterium sp. CHNK8]QZK90806.1 DUF5706 domain-containing protein [Flavobacterium sp. CHNK8]